MTDEDPETTAMNRGAELDRYKSVKKSDSESKNLDSTGDSPVDWLPKLEWQENRIYWLTIAILGLTLVQTWNGFLEPRESRWLVCKGTIGLAFDICPENPFKDSSRSSVDDQKWKEIYFSDIRDGLRETRGQASFGQIVAVPGLGYLVVPYQRFPNWNWHQIENLKRKGGARRPRRAH